MFQVLEGIKDKEGSLKYEKPCNSSGFSWATTWKNSEFMMWSDAVVYANHWLGREWERPESDWKVDEPFFYCGTSYVVIRSVEYV
jgi:hypothetical protein